MNNAVKVEDQTTARVDDEWWDLRSGPGAVVDRLLHPRAAVTSSRDWWEATSSDVLDRQAGREMPAVLIRQLDNLRRVSSVLGGVSHSDIIARQAAMILRASEESIPEEGDQRDVRMAYDELIAELHLGGLTPEG